jgi:hypothetical protein
VAVQLHVRVLYTNVVRLSVSDILGKFLEPEPVGEGAADNPPRRSNWQFAGAKAWWHRHLRAWCYWSETGHCTVLEAGGYRGLETFLCLKPKVVLRRALGHGLDGMYCSILGVAPARIIPDMYCHLYTQCASERCLYIKYNS